MIDSISKRACLWVRESAVREDAFVCQTERECVRVCELARAANE